PVQDEALDGGRVLGPRVVPPAARDEPQLEAAPLRRVLVRERTQRGGDLPPGPLQELGQVLLGGGLVHDHQYGFEGGPQIEVGDRPQRRGQFGVLVAHAFSSSVAFPGGSGGRSNSSVTTGSATPSPVQRTISSPRASSWSRATAFSRYSSSRA